MSDKNGNTGSENSGNRNSGNRNSGNRNSGNLNSGNRNSGNLNSGNRNSGDWNSGNLNSGNLNSGDWNSGNLNSGDWNSGDWNSGNRNSGNWNSGDWNSGNLNSGDWNSGNLNSGNRNSGNRNSGDWNSGNRNSGHLNSDEPTVRLFNKDTGLSFDAVNAMMPQIMRELILTEWIPFIQMSDEEKTAWPKAYVCDGYLKKYDFKVAVANLWKRVTKEDIDKIKALPNFDSKIFEEITGIKISTDSEVKLEILKRADELAAKVEQLREDASKL